MLPSVQGLSSKCLHQCNLRIRLLPDKFSAEDAGLAFFSFGQVRCMDIVVEGDVIKWNRDYILQTSKPKED